MLFGVHRNRTHVMNHDRSPNDPDASNGLRCRFTKWSCFPSFGDPIVVRFGARGGGAGGGNPLMDDVFPFPIFLVQYAAPRFELASLRQLQRLDA